MIIGQHFIHHHAGSILTLTSRLRLFVCLFVLPVHSFILSNTLDAPCVGVLSAVVSGFEPSTTTIVAWWKLASFGQRIVCDVLVKHTKCPLELTCEDDPDDDQQQEDEHILFSAEQFTDGTINDLLRSSSLADFNLRKHVINIEKDLRFFSFVRRLRKLRHKTDNT